MKNLKNLPKKFWEFPPCHLIGPPKFLSKLWFNMLYLVVFYLTSKSSVNYWAFHGFGQAKFPDGGSVLNTLVGSNQDNFFEGATVCSKRTLKTRVTTQLYFGSGPTNQMSSVLHDEMKTSFHAWTIYVCLQIDIPQRCLSRKQYNFLFSIVSQIIDAAVRNLACIWVCI